MYTYYVVVFALDTNAYICSACYKVADEPLKLDFRLHVIFLPCTLHAHNAWHTGHCRLGLIICMCTYILRDLSLYMYMYNVLPWLVWIEDVHTVEPPWYGHHWNPTKLSLVRRLCKPHWGSPASLKVLRQEKKAQRRPDREWYMYLDIWRFSLVNQPSSW